MKIKALNHFYDFISHTIFVKKNIAGLCIRNENISDDVVESLESALYLLENIPGSENKKLLTYNDETIFLDLTYEILELKKDLYYIKNGETDFYNYLNKIHNKFYLELKAGCDFLENVAIDNFISDRDGTINNYCGRYNSSVQSIYNAVFLTDFAKKVKRAVIVTAAPLINTGIVDISVIPDDVYIYAGSKGRDFFNKEGKRIQYPITVERQEKLALLNERIAGLLNFKENSVFSLIGSGFQRKFGQTSISRQDIFKSIDREKSENFMEEVVKLVQLIDPDGTVFAINDTGKDIEINLIEDNEDNYKEFDKGDGLKFLDQEVHFNFNDSTTLICGDTESDIPMLEIVAKHSGNLYTIFITDDEELKDRVKSVCKNSFFVSSPDILVAILNELSK